VVFKVPLLELLQHASYGTELDVDDPRPNNLGVQLNLMGGAKDVEDLLRTFLTRAQRPSRFVNLGLLVNSSTLIQGGFLFSRKSNIVAAVRTSGVHACLDPLLDTPLVNEGSAAWHGFFLSSDCA
jgi:hypothetical protein